MSVFEQCRVIELPRSSYYFRPKGESLFNQQLMNAIDSGSWTILVMGWSG
ncbi:hypothetical protein [Parapedobacter composti]|nr:hypothetical protein [Parapedobacter composti]